MSAMDWIFVRARGGLLDGREIAISTGDLVRIGRVDGVELDLRDAVRAGDRAAALHVAALAPILLQLQSLGEGVVRVQALAEGVAVRGRPIDDRVEVDAKDQAFEVTFGGGETLLISHGVFQRSNAPLELAFEDAGPAPPLRRPKRPRSRLWSSLLWRPKPHPERPAILISVAAHVAVALLFMWLLGLVDWTTPRPPIRFRIALDMSRPNPDDPEAARGRGETDALEGTENALVDETSLKSPGGNLDELGGDIPGRALDRERDHTTEGVGGAPAGSFFVGRRAASEARLASGGGDAEAEGALRRALAWLARHQEPDGTWSAVGSVTTCGDPRCAGAGTDAYRDGVTALALLPFLGAGHDHLSGPWQKTVRAGLVALLARQHDDGSFGKGAKKGYESALATVALAEAYGLTHARGLREPLERAIGYWSRTQSERGGWRYAPGDDGADTSVTGWVALGLAAARKAGIEVPDRTLGGCRRWISGHVGRDGRVGYASRSTGTTALLGVGYFVSSVLGRTARTPSLAATADRLALSMPRWPSDRDDGAHSYGTADPSHWYYGSLGAYQIGGGTWTAWEERLRSMLLEHQERAGDAIGSWPSRGQTGRHGGRVVMTAFCALCLEVAYRYPRIVGNER